MTVHLVGVRRASCACTNHITFGLNLHHCIAAFVLSLALFCTPPPLRVSTTEEANGTETVSRVMADVNAICLHVVTMLQVCFFKDRAANSHAFCVRHTHFYTISLSHTL